MSLAIFRFSQSDRVVEFMMTNEVLPFASKPCGDVATNVDEDIPNHCVGAVSQLIPVVCR
jgi:hypothetical protein